MGLVGPVISFTESDHGNKSQLPASAGELISFNGVWTVAFSNVPHT